mmetsp:Transcript_2488/g.8363  ORF Transcript_2488/g.8363 Transcript_2488/m.8363 type:complete len:222 (-) Transcript_2488:911-1576(-)
MTSRSVGRGAALATRASAASASDRAAAATLRMSSTASGVVPCSIVAAPRAASSRRSASCWALAAAFASFFAARAALTDAGMDAPRSSSSPSVMGTAVARAGCFAPSNGVTTKRFSRSRTRAPPWYARRFSTRCASSRSHARFFTSATPCSVTFDISTIFAISSPPGPFVRWALSMSSRSCFRPASKSSTFFASVLFATSTNCLSAKSARMLWNRLDCCSIV